MISRKKSFSFIHSLDYVINFQPIRTIHTLVSFWHFMFHKEVSGFLLKVVGHSWRDYCD